MTEVPREELLLKLLKMTTSDSDGECLTAIRKANELLRNSGWDWDKLIHSKIKIIEDPFKNLGEPPKGSSGAYNSKQSQNAHAPPPPRPTQPATPPKPQTWPLGIQPNKFAGFCYCCGDEVMANDGVIFKPYAFNAGASNDWKVACLPCNGTQARQGAPVFNYAAHKRRGTTAKGKPKPFVSDLS